MRTKLLRFIPTLLLAGWLGGCGGGTTGNTDSDPPSTNASPAGGQFTDQVEVTLACDDGAGSGCASTYYTMDGSEPDSLSDRYDGPITLTSSIVLRYSSVDADGNRETPRRMEFSISPAIATDTGAPTTTANPAGGNITGQIQVALNCDDGAGSGCTATYFTLDGNLPDTSSTLYEAPIEIATTTVLQFFSVDAEGNREASNRVEFSIETVADATPPSTVAEPGAGEFVDSVSVQLHCSDDSSGDCAFTYYTLDGSEPTTDSNVYSRNLLITATNPVLRYFSIDRAGNAEAAQTATYTITERNLDQSPPTLSIAPAPGNFFNRVDVELTCVDTESGCEAIYYTLDGSDPDTGSSRYSSSLALDTSSTVRYMASDTRGNQTPIAQVRYEILIDVDAPVTSANPPAQSFLGSVVLELSCADGRGSGCAGTYYTLDGSAPSRDSSLYSSPIRLDASTAVRFLSVDAAGNQEPMRSIIYTALDQTNCDPAGDLDGDLLGDCEELAGWLVTVDRDGRNLPEQYHVESNPTLADTDGDGLDDREEKLQRGDPNSADTDSDGLNDAEEVHVYDTNLADVDSDDDALIPGSGIADSRFFDGNELAHIGTSPTMADTDGDGRNDLSEFQANDNPLVADLPSMQLRWVGGLTVNLDQVISQGCSLGLSTYSAVLEQNATASTQTSSSATKQTAVHGLEISGSLSSQAFPPNVSHSITGTASASFGTVSEYSTAWTQSSARSVQNEFRQARDASCFEQSSTSGGVLSGGFQITNDGSEPFTVDRVSATILRRDDSQPDGFVTLAGVNSLLESGGTALAPGGATGVVAVQVDLPAAVAMELLDDPSGLLFQAATYTISDEAGRNAVYIENNVLDRTAGIQIDFGNGEVRRLFVATEVDRSIGGIRLADALDAARIPFTTVQSATGARVLASVEGVMFDETVSQFWYLSGSNTELGSLDTDAEDILLRAGDFITLALLRDGDGDGLFDREERIYGTDIDLADSDGDMIDDLAEVSLPGRNPVTPEFPGQFVTQLHKGESHALAVLENGTLWSWGANSVGQLGRTGPQTRPHMVGTERNWRKAMASNTAFSVALKADGSLWSWGSDGFGGLGNGSAQTTDFAEPRQIGTATDWSDFGVGTGHVLAINDAGELWSWGWNRWSQLGYASDHECSNFGATENCQMFPKRVGSATNWRSVVGGQVHSLGIRHDASLWAWGGNHSGELGTGDGQNRVAPTRVGDETGWQQVSAGRSVSMAVKTVCRRINLRTGLCDRADSDVYSWGDNRFGSVGAATSDSCISSSPCARTPQALVIPAGALQCLPGGLCPVQLGPVNYKIQAGFTGFAINGQGELYSWGLASPVDDPQANDLGRPTQAICTTASSGSRLCAREPGRVGEDRDWSRLGGFEAGVRTDGSVWTWGDNNAGQLGLGHLNPAAEPTMVPASPLP